jgi:hypothetical protein
MTFQSRIPVRNYPRRVQRTLIAGGADSIGSHLCDSLPQRGDEDRADFQPRRRVLQSQSSSLEGYGDRQDQAFT